MQQVSAVVPHARNQSWILFKSLRCQIAWTWDGGIIEVVSRLTSMIDVFAVPARRCPGVGRRHTCGRTPHDERVCVAFTWRQVGCARGRKPQSKRNEQVEGGRDSNARRACIIRSGLVAAAADVQRAWRRPVEGVAPDTAGCDPGSGMLSRIRRCRVFGG